MHELIKKYLVGGITLHVKLFGWDRYVGFPKVAPWFTIGIFLMGVFQSESPYSIPTFFWSGVVITTIAVFGFLYYDIFPGQRPGPGPNAGAAA